MYFFNLFAAKSGSVIFSEQGGWAGRISS